MPHPTLDDEIDAVTREIKMRQRVYPRWVADKRMSQAKADHEIACMKAVEKRLIQIRNETRPQLKF